MSSSNRRRCPVAGFIAVVATAACGSSSVIGHESGTGGASGTGNPGTAGAGGGAGVSGDAGTVGTAGALGTAGKGGSADGCALAAGGAAGTGVAFLPAVQYPTHRGSMFVALGDLNGDGRPDLVVTNALADEQSDFSNFTGSVTVFLSEGSSGYGPARHYVQDGRPTSAAVGDLNGDGKADVAVSNFQSATVMLNDGAGALSAPVGYATGTYPSSIAIGDLNGDGRNDLAVANAGEESRPGDVAVLLNVGNRMFTATNYAAGTGPVHVAIGDLNADGKPDLAVSSGSSVNVLFNQGNGFAPPATYGAGTNPTNAVIADLNGDCRPDLAAGRDSGGAAVILSTGAGVFAAAVVYPLPPAYTRVAIGDLNLDGKLDVVSVTGDGSGGAVTFLLNAGNGTFGPFGSIGVNVSPVSVSVGDLNRDGKPDLVVPHNDGVAVLLNAAP